MSSAGAREATGPVGAAHGYDLYYLSTPLWPGLSAIGCFATTPSMPGLPLPNPQHPNPRRRRTDANKLQKTSSCAGPAATVLIASALLSIAGCSGKGGWKFNPGRRQFVLDMTELRSLSRSSRAGRRGRSARHQYCSGYRRSNSRCTVNGRYRGRHHRAAASFLRRTM